MTPKKYPSSSLNIFLNFKSLKTLLLPVRYKIICEKRNESIHLIHASAISARIDYNYHNRFKLYD